MDETTSVKRVCGGNSLHSSPPSSTYIPLDILRETILCRLPVKSLLRFRCVCNSWNHLISKDLKFAKKHLRVSLKRQHLITTTWKMNEELTVTSCPFDSLDLHSTFDSKSTQLDYSPIISTYGHGFVSSCDGILCFAVDGSLPVLYNPFIRKVKKLPYIDLREGSTHYAFGYDPFIDNYKVVAVCEYATKVEVLSYTLGTDSWKSWKRIFKGFPSMFYFDGNGPLKHGIHGIFMRGTVNWLAFGESDYYVIVSLHLGKESYQQISLPNLSDNTLKLTLYVMRDCLCVFGMAKERAPKFDSFTDVWLMKEYENKESWIKLFRLPFFGDFAICTNIVYISEDYNHVLLEFILNGKFKWMVYDLKNDTITIKNSKIQDNSDLVKSKVYVESLISPS